MVQAAYDTLSQSMALSAVTALLAGYLAGSISFAYIVAGMKGVDLRHYGSGNIGATNLGRVAGAGWGFTVLLLDVSKGFLPVLAAKMLKNSDFRIDTVYLMLLAGSGAVIGHTYSVWLKFKGGRGVATGLGVMIALVPPLTAISAVIFLIAVIPTKMVSLGSILAAAALPFTFFIFYEYNGNEPLYWFICAIVLFVIFKHRPNIKRLIDGTELKFKKDTKNEGDPE